MDDIKIHKDYFGWGTLPRNATHDDIIKGVYEVLNKDFRTTFDYTKAEPTIYKGEKMPTAFTSNVFAAAFGFYCYSIGYYFLYGDIKLDDFMDKELRYYEYELGGSCIYNTVLYLSLLASERIVCKDCIKIAQGYYKHKLREDFPKFIPFGENHLGTHAWALLNNCIIDFNIVPQEEKFFDFEDKIMVMGEAPNGMEYIGYAENYSMVKAYAEDIAAYSKMDYDTWILKHKIKALEIYSEHLESIKYS